MQISIRAEDIFHIGNFPITNSILLALVAFVVLVIFAIILRSKLALIPGGIQNIAEVILEGTLGLMDSVLGDRRKSEKYLPLVLTVFLFILCSSPIISSTYIAPSVVTALRLGSISTFSHVELSATCVPSFSSVDLPRYLYTAPASPPPE